MIDLVASNFYPFQQTIANPKTSREAMRAILREHRLAAWKEIANGKTNPLA